MNKEKENFLKHIREKYYPDLTREEFENGFSFESEMVNDGFSPYGSTRLIKTYYSFSYKNSVISYTDQKYF